jgi:hypothetical protein
VAVLCAALANPSPVWTGVLLALTAQALLFAAFRALSPRVRQPAAYVGFMAGCLGYLALAFGPWFDRPVLRSLGPFHAYDRNNTVFSISAIEISSRRMADRTLGRFPPTWLLEELRLRIQMQRRASVTDDFEHEFLVLSSGIKLTRDLSKFSVPPPQLVPDVNPPPISLDIWKERENAFFQCGHLLLSWVAGLVMAAAARGVLAFARRAAKGRPLRGSSLPAHLPGLTPAAGAE